MSWTSKTAKEIALCRMKQEKETQDEGGDETHESNPPTLAEQPYGRGRGREVADWTRCT